MLSKPSVDVKAQKYIEIDTTVLCTKYNTQQYIAMFSERILILHTDVTLSTQIFRDLLFREFGKMIHFLLSQQITKSFVSNVQSDAPEVK